MPRPPRTQRVEVPSNSLVAAGQNMRAVAANQTKYQYGQPWQAETWGYYDTIGELRYAATWFSKVLSRARLYPALREGSGFKEQKDGAIYDVVSEWFDGPAGQSGMLASIGLHLFVVGECYVVKRKPRADRGEKGSAFIYEVVGIEEMSVLGEVWTIRPDDGKPNIILGPGDDVVRVWYPHPKKRINADAPARAILSSLREIERITQHIFAQLVSRLTGAGLLLLPQGMTFPSPPDNTLPEDASDADRVMAVLYQAFTTAIMNPGDASAMAPIVMLVPDEFIDKANLLKFWTDLDEKAIEMRQAAVKRAAIGLDLPVEVLTGTADVNHWGQWSIDESAIKSHIEPALEMIVTALNVGYITEECGDPKGVARYDTSAMRLRPNRSKEAIELYDRGELDAEALRRETGFGEDDAPDDDEKKLWLLAKIIANSSATPEMMATALRVLGVDVGDGTSGQDPANDSRPDPSLEDHPTQDIPEDIPAAVDVGILGSAQALAYRALERAGNRLKSKRGIRPVGMSAADIYLHHSVKPDEVDALLEDAWTCLPQVMRSIPFDQQLAITAGLDSYVRALLMGGLERDDALLHRHLLSAPVRQLA